MNLSRAEGLGGTVMDGSSTGLAQDADNMLRSVLGTLGGGVIVFDLEMRVVTANALAHELLDIPPDMIASGKSWIDFMRFAAERGDYGSGDPDANIARIIALFENGEPYSLTRQRPDGAILEVHGDRSRTGSSRVFATSPSSAEMKRHCAM